MPVYLCEKARDPVTPSTPQLLTPPQHLCDIPEDRISEVEIPTGLPLIYDVNQKCIKLLDDGSGRDLRQTYNFGKVR